MAKKNGAERSAARESVRLTKSAVSFLRVQVSKGREPLDAKSDPPP